MFVPFIQDIRPKQRIIAVILTITFYNYTRPNLKFHFLIFIIACISFKIG